MIDGGKEMTDREHMYNLMVYTVNECIEDNPFFTYSELLERIADRLISAGVIMLPCKVGDMVYWYSRSGEIIEAKIIKNGFCAKIESGFEYDVGYDEIGKTVFFTREEAEAALSERKDK